METVIQKGLINTLSCQSDNHLFVVGGGVYKCQNAFDTHSTCTSSTSKVYSGVSQVFL